MLTTRQKSKIIKESRVHEKDTGSAAVQIKLLNQRVEELAQHLKKHPKDVHSRRGLIKIVAKRRRLEKSLKTTKKEISSKSKPKKETSSKKKK